MLCQIQRSVCIGTLLLLLFPFAASAQQRDLQERLHKGIEKAERLLQQLRQQKDSLQSRQEAIPDSMAVLQVKLDSLQFQYPDSALLAQKSDSLLQALLKQEEVQAQLQEAESKLEQEIGQAKEQLTKQLRQEQTQEALDRLEAAGNSAGGSLADMQKMAQVPELPELSQLQKLPDLEELQENLKQEAGKVATDYLTTQQERLSQEVPDLEGYKSRVEKLGSVKDLPRGALKVQPMGDKPWQERVVLGTLWQLGKQEVYFLDLGPNLAWRFTERLSVGAGFQYRLSLDVQRKPWSVGTHDRVLGYFAFSDFEVKQGFFGRLHYEDLSSPVPRTDATTQAETIGQEWVKGLSVGVGKSYALFKQVQGYALVQYNVLHQHDRTPYLHPLQAKVGLYINGKHLLRKKKK